MRMFVIFLEVWRFREFCFDDRSKEEIGKINFNVEMIYFVRFKFKFIVLMVLKGFICLGKV